VLLSATSTESDMKHYTVIPAVSENPDLIYRYVIANYDMLPLFPVSQCRDWIHLNGI
jgi:hypothetical protein